MEFHEISENQGSMYSPHPRPSPTQEQRGAAQQAILPE